jgi:predicted oxidoreductase
MNRDHSAEDYQTQIARLTAERDALRADLTARDCELNATRAELTRLRAIEEAAKGLCRHIVKVLKPCSGLDTSHGSLADEFVPIAEAILRGEGPEKRGQR